MTTAHTFQIVRVSPVYHFSTDALIGSKAHPLPMPYRSEALAHKLAGRLAQQDYESCGDDSFVVVPYGESAFTSTRHGTVSPSDWTDDGFPF